MGVEVGQKYAYRKREHALGEPARPVLVTKEGPPKSYKFRIRWLDGEYEGMEEWVRKAKLLCRWDEVEAYLRDERCLLAALAASEGTHESIAWKAVREVLFAWTDCPLDLSRARSGLVEIEDFPSTLHEVGLSPDQFLAEPLAYVDRFGDYWAPFAVGLRIAEELAKKDPRRVLARIELEEQAIRASVVNGYYVSPRFPDIEYVLPRYAAEERLREAEAVFGLIRHWCGDEAVYQYNEVQALRDKVTELRSLVEYHITWLRDAGERHKLPWLKAKATVLQKKLNRAPTL